MQTQSVHGVKLAYSDRGSGLPVVLIHGFPLDHTMWDAQIEALAGRWRVIAPDLRGFGRSSVIPGTATMEQMAGDVAGLLEAIGVGTPVVLAGLSMGGYVALSFCRQYGHRLRGLILCDTRAAPDTPEAAAGRRETAARVLREGTAPLADAMLPRLLAPSTLQNRPDLVEALRRAILRADPQAIAAASLGMAERPDATPLLSAIACPALVVVGQQDAISPVPEMSKLAEAMPRAQLAVIRDAGHMSPMENPAEVNRAMVSFLEEIANDE